MSHQGAENLMVAKCQNQKHHLSGTETKKPQTSIVLNQSSEPVFRTHAPCPAEAPEHSTE